MSSSIAHKTLGCICYTNKTCIETPVDECFDCTRDDYLLEPLKHCNGALQTKQECANLVCPEQVLTENCVCYKEGTCYR